MSKNIGHLQHVKSSVVENGQPKLPTSNVLVEGELAINYAKGYETISLRNSESGITRFSSDDYYTLLKLGSGFTGENSSVTVTDVIRDNEHVIAAALNDLDGKKMDISAYTPTDLSDYYTKEQTSGSTELNEAFAKKVDASWINEKLGSGFTGENSSNTVTSVIRDNELVTSAALNDLDDRKLDVSAYTPTDLSGYYTKSETSGKTELEEEFGKKVNTTWLDEKLGDDFTGENSSNTVTSVIRDNELVTSAALNDLNSRKLDISAYTESSANYYTKSETSGSTELEEEFNKKVNATWLDEKLGSGFTGENSANTVTSVIRDNELVISSAFNDLNDRKLDISAYTESSANYYTKSETSGSTELNEAFAEKVDVSWLDEKLGSGFTGENSAVTVTDVLDEHEEVTAAALNDLNNNKLDISAYTPTDLANYYTKSETSGSTELNEAFAEKVDASWLDEKLGSGFTGENSANTVTDVIEENELVVSSALNDLNDRIDDISAYTQTELSGYYTKTEVNGIIDSIITALSGKGINISIN